MINKLKFIPILLLALFQLKAQNDSAKNFIEVIGEAEIEVVPDEIFIAFTLEERELDDEEIGLDQAEKALSDTLQSLGIKAPVLTNSNAYTSQFFFSRRQEERREYQVMVQDAQSLKTVFEILKKIGVVKANIEKLSHSKIEELEIGTRLKAIENAIEKADDMLAPLRQKRKAPMLVKELARSSIITGGLPAQYDVNSFRYQEPSRSTKENLSFQKLLIRVRVYVIFEID